MRKKADEDGGIGTKSDETGVSGGGISLRSLKTFSSLKNPAYRLYYVALVSQWASRSMQMVARSLLVYRITGSGAILGLMALVYAIPSLLMSLFGGAIADRVQKKYVMFFGQLCCAVVALGIALALTLGYLGPQHPGSWWILMAAAGIQGAVWGFTTPSQQAIIPEIVSEKQVMNAISLNNLGMNSLRLAVPALAGFLIDTFDFKAVYYTTASIYVIATICVAFLPRTRAMSPREGRALTDVLEGVRYIRRETTILLIVTFCLCGFILGTPFTFLMPMFTEDILKVGASGLGLLMSFSGLGAIFGSLVLASLPSKKRGVMLLLSGLIMGLALMGFSFSHWWYLSLIIIVFVGLGQTGHMTMGNTLAIYYSDPDYRGRVMSFHGMGHGFASIGTFFAGILAEAVGVQWAIGGMAMTLALISIIVFNFTSRLRKLD